MVWRSGPTCPGTVMPACMPQCIGEPMDHACRWWRIDPLRLLTCRTRELQRQRTPSTSAAAPCHQRRRRGFHSSGQNTVVGGRLEHIMQYYTADDTEEPSTTRGPAGYTMQERRWNSSGKPSCTFSNEPDVVEYWCDHSLPNSTCGIEM